MPKSGIAGLYGSSIFSFLKHPYCFPEWLHQFNLHSHQQCRRVLFFYLGVSLNWGHSVVCKEPTYPKAFVKQFHSVPSSYHMMERRLQGNLFFFFKETDPSLFFNVCLSIYLFLSWLRQVLVVALRIFTVARGLPSSCGTRAPVHRLQ